MLEWTTTRQLAASNGVKILGYGHSGEGKTRICGTAPAPIMLCAESRTMSVQQEIPVMLIRSLTDLAEGYRWLAQSQEAIHVLTACLDSITEIADVVLMGFKPQFKDTRQAYYATIDTIVPWIRAFRDLPKHVYMSAKIEYVKDEATGACKWGPQMPGRALGPQMPYMFDEVFRFGSARAADGKKYHFLQTEADTQYDAKDASGKLDPYEYPDLTHIINKITKGQ
jgi:hypothetical protein